MSVLQSAEYGLPKGMLSLQEGITGGAQLKRQILRSGPETIAVYKTESTSAVD